MLKSSCTACSHITTGTVTLRNFAATSPEATVEETIINCLPSAFEVAEVGASCTVTCHPCDSSRALIAASEAFSVGILSVPTTSNACGGGVPTVTATESDVCDCPISSNAVARMP